MQALFENPLAEPGLLGVSNGAGVGLIAAVLLGQGQLPNWALGLCAIAGALIITLILLRFARRHLSTSRLLLAGVALRSEEHTSELQSRFDLVCRLLL